MSEKSRIDPRFDPAFQRGYEGGAAGAPRAQPSVRSEGHVGLPPGTPPSMPMGAAPAVPASPIVTPDVELTREASAEEPLGRNPFVVAAWVLSIVLAVAGPMFAIWAQAASYNASYSSTDIPFEILLSQLSYVISGPAASAGFIGIVALLLWHANEWRARARRAAASEALRRGPAA